MMNISELKDRKILVIGDLILDTYHKGKVNRISPEAPIPVVRVTESYSVLGGAANVARNVNSLHSVPVVIGVCGRDHNGTLMRRLFEEVHIKNHIVECDYPTITKTRIVGNNQQIVRVDFEDKEMHLSDTVYAEVKKHISEQLPSADIVVLSDYGKGFCNYSLCQYVIELSLKSNKTVIIDPKGNDWEKYRGASVITPNLKELSDVFGKDVPNEDEIIVDVARSLCNQYKIDTILATRSEKGMTLINCSNTKHLRTVAKEVFDVSGAGDTVVATLAVSLASGRSMFKSIETANEAAGIVVGKFGTQPITLEELQLKSLHVGNEKLLDGDELNSLLKYLREQHKRIVFTNGCFDIIHKGHVSYLQKAREMGDLLIVGLNSDASVKRLKGESRPVNQVEARATVLSALSCVDYIVVFEEDTPYRLISEVRPDVLVKGGDYQVENVVGKEFAKEVKLIDFVDGYSSSRIIKELNS